MVDNMSIGNHPNIQRLAGDLKAAKQNGSIDPDKFIRDLTPKQLEKLGFDVDNGAFDFTGWSTTKIKTKLMDIVKQADPTDPAPSDISFSDYVMSSGGSDNFGSDFANGLKTIGEAKAHGHGLMSSERAKMLDDIMNQ